MKKTFKRFWVYAFITLSVSGCNTVMYVQEEKVLYKDVEILLYETSIKDIEEQFGKRYEKIDWDEFSTEYNYKSKGISFSHKQKDSLKMVYWVNVETNKNTINIENRIKIDKQSTVSDAVDKLGNGTWDYDSTYNGLIIEYEYYDLIIALSERDIQTLNKESTFEDWEKLYNQFKGNHIKGIEVY
ncbi:MAG: hypothetical protein AAF206_25815 [Bacteroidota bacterium]